MQYKELEVDCLLAPGGLLLGTECTSGREQCTVTNSTGSRVKLSGFPPPKSCVTLAELLNFSVPEFPHQ